MKSYLEKLRLRHRRIDRLIDTSKSAGKQAELQVLKRIRLQLKDQIAELQRRAKQAPSH